MKLNKLIVFISIVFILTISIGAISASDNLNNDTIANDNSYDNLETGDDDIVSASDEEVLSDTIPVEFEKNKPNDVLWPKIQAAIDSANPGDTVLIKGSPVHVHVIINKTITVTSDYRDSSIIDACPHHTHYTTYEEGPDIHGVFYVNAKGSGSTIQGFNFVNNDKSENPFGIYVEGASDVTIKDCTMADSNPDATKQLGMLIKDSNNVILSNLVINNTLNGINIINSTNILITNCTLSYNENYAISVSGDSKNITIRSNSILNNGKFGINLESINYVYVLNNLIKDNGKSSGMGSGIYVNNNITKLIVKGNFFIGNKMHAILYDYRTRNLNNDEGANSLTIVDNNYFEGQGSMILHHTIYREYSGGGMAYDAEKDIFYPSEDGGYVEDTSTVYMLHAFVSSDMVCGHTYYTPTIPWTLNAPGNNGKYDFSLHLTDIQEIKNGIYQISIVDSQGNVASDFNDEPVIFYLNKNNHYVSPQEGDVYKTVMLVNGSATARFYHDEFNETGNVVSAVIPGAFINFYPEDGVNARAFNVDDSNIPVVTYFTKIIISDFTTYPNSNADFTITLMDTDNNCIVANEPVVFNINSEDIVATTDQNGRATIAINQGAGNYVITVRYNGENIQYEEAIAQANIAVKPLITNIVASDYAMFAMKKGYYSVVLKDSNGKAISNQNVIFQVNKQTYTVKTNAKGEAKISLKLNKGNYPVLINFKGNNMYLPVSKTTKIVVNPVKTKLTAPKIKARKNTKVKYTITLKDQFGKAVKKQKVTVKVNGKTYTKKTSSKGKITVQVKFSKAKTYNVKVTYKGSNIYKKSKATGKITVKK